MRSSRATSACHGACFTLTALTCTYSSKQVKAELWHCLVMPLQPIWFTLLSAVLSPISLVLPSITVENDNFKAAVATAAVGYVVIAGWVVADGLSGLLPWLKQRRAEAAGRPAEERHRKRTPVIPRDPNSPLIEPLTEEPRDGQGDRV
jgi:hypothetical protein